MNWSAFNKTVAVSEYPWLGSDHERIRAALGPDGVALAEQMRAFAGNQPDLREPGVSWIAVQPEMSRRLRAQFPLLSKPAADRIALAAAYSWR